MKMNVLYWLLFLATLFIAFFPIIIFEPTALLSFGWVLLVGIIGAALVPKIIRCSSCKEPLFPYYTVRGIKFLMYIVPFVPMECKKCGCKIK